MKYLILTLFLLVNLNQIEALTYYPEFKCTQYVSLSKTDYPEFKIEKKEKPQVRVYVNSAEQFNQISKFSGCVPQIDFIVTLNVPEWVKSYPTFEWVGDDNERYYTDQDLEGFTKKFTEKNPSFSEQVKFDYIEAQELGYPIRSGYWSVSGNWNPTREQVIYHLMYNPNHSGKFKSSTLVSKTLDELQSLHSDDHEGRVKWSYLKGNQKTKIKVKEVAAKEEIQSQKIYYDQAKPAVNIFQRKGRRAYRSSCPNGRCPY